MPTCVCVRAWCRWRRWLSLGVLGVAPNNTPDVDRCSGVAAASAGDEAEVLGRVVLLIVLLSLLLLLLGMLLGMGVAVGNDARPDPLDVAAVGVRTPLR